MADETQPKTKEKIDWAGLKLIGREAWHRLKNFRETNYNLGVNQIKDQQWQDACVRFWVATKMTPSHADSWAYLAQSYSKLGKADKAHKAIDRALALAPGNAEYTAFAAQIKHAKTAA